VNKVRFFHGKKKRIRLLNVEPGFFLSSGESERLGSYSLSAFVELALQLVLHGAAPLVGFDVGSVSLAV
jgi:hypothetical protein